MNFHLAYRKWCMRLELDSVGNWEAEESGERVLGGWDSWCYVAFPSKREISKGSDALLWLHIVNNHLKTYFSRFSIVEITEVDGIHVLIKISWYSGIGVECGVRAFWWKLSSIPSAAIIEIFPLSVQRFEKRTLWQFCCLKTVEKIIN